MLTSDIENFPGYPKGIGGPEMMMELREQAERFGLEVHDKNVERVDLSRRPYSVWVEGEEYKSESLIICTGAESIWLRGHQCLFGLRQVRGLDAHLEGHARRS